MSEKINDSNFEPRRHWMGVLARADLADLERHWKRENGGVHYRHLRPPETGLVMARGRAGGNGQRFNLGEMTVTRCSLQFPDGIVGHGYVAGRDRRHAELAAAFDALLQRPERQEQVKQHVIHSLEQKYIAEKEDRSKKAAATKVDFYTMVRGEDAS